MLPYSSYRNKLTDEKLIRVSAIAEVQEMGSFILVLKDISLEPPHLSIEVRHLHRDGAQGSSDPPNAGPGDTVATETWTLPGTQSR